MSSISQLIFIVVNADRYDLLNLWVIFCKRRITVIPDRTCQWSYMDPSKESISLLGNSFNNWLVEGREQNRFRVQVSDCGVHQKGEMALSLLRPTKPRDKIINPSNQFVTCTVFVLCLLIRPVLKRQCEQRMNQSFLPSNRTKSYHFLLWSRPKVSNHKWGLEIQFFLFFQYWLWHLCFGYWPVLSLILK